MQIPARNCATSFQSSWELAILHPFPDPAGSFAKEDKYYQGIIFFAPRGKWNRKLLKDTTQTQSAQEEKRLELKELYRNFLCPPQNQTKPFLIALRSVSSSPTKPSSRNGASRNRETRYPYLLASSMVSEHSVPFKSPSFSLVCLKTSFTMVVSWRVFKSACLAFYEGLVFPVVIPFQTVKGDFCKFRKIMHHLPK